jgi:zinc protease
MKQAMNLRFLPAVLAVLALPLPAIAQAPEYAVVAEASPDPWPFAASDLPADPDYHVGVLPNGMRYVIRPNATPPGQGMVRLWVDFGSAAEAEHEQGWAHFIEHMAFNGSTNVPEGEMVQLLEREGLAFGADTNASTGFDTTTYQLDLPRNDLALLDTALMLMRETASELTFDETAVERERGVILSERRVRDTFALQNIFDNLAFLYPGTPLATRIPIGTVETIGGATGAGMRDLWARYYRPENVALVVIGDYDPAAVEAAIHEHFADWQAPPRLPPVSFGPVDPARGGEVDIFVDPALSEEVTISRSGACLCEPDTVATRQMRLLRQIGYGIVNRRLQRLARSEDPPYRSAGLGMSEMFREARTVNLVVQAAEGEWPRALAAAQEEYRRALEFGFSEGEVAEQVANLRSSIESNAAGAATRHNRNFETGAFTLLRDGQVPTTPESALERFNAFAPTITPAAVLEAMKGELLPLENPLIRFEGRTAPEGGAEALRAAWDAGMAAPLAAGENTQAAEFAYTDFGPAGAVISDSVEERLGIRRVVFANGLMLNLKRTDLQANRVMVELNVDGGDLIATRDNPLATAMTSSLLVGGLGKHTLDELQSVLAGRQVSLDVASAEESFRLRSTSTPGDLELQLQLFAAALADPGFRPTGEAQYRRNVQNYFAQTFATPGNALSSSIGGIISGGDPRETLQPQDAYMALSFAKLRADIIDRWQNGALELALVGEVDEDAAIALVARTLGALPAREPAFRDYAGNRDRAFTADRSPRTVYHDGEADQAMVVMAWPTRDDSDQRASQTLALLEQVMKIELMDKLREELGQTYSPGADASQSRVFPGYGTFDISAAVDVADVDATRTAMLETVAALIAAPVDEDVLLRARAPMLERYANSLDTNGGWMSLVDRAQTQPERLDRFLAGEAMLRSLTATEVQAAAARYLDPDQRLEVLVLPRG